MLEGIAASVSGMLNALRRTAVTANNIANVQTPGYRAARAENIEQADGGVRIGAITRDESPGPLLLDETANGFREGSNVDLTTENVNLLLNRRQFEANAAALRAQDDALSDLLDRGA